MNEADIFKNHMADLSRASYERNIYTFSDFLTLAEQSDCADAARGGRLFTGGYESFGGYEGAERIIVRFGSFESLGYEQPWPITCIRITPLNRKFSEELSHRDILGSLMNLGIERHLLGDILIPHTLKEDPGSKTQPAAFVFAKDHIADTVCRELTRIKHTSVMAEAVDNPLDIPKPSLKDTSLQIKSERCDLIIAHAYNLSRSQAAELFPAQKVFINGRLNENESHILCEGDIVSVRGMGRFIYRGICSNTRKGNFNVTISRYC